jgi:hypothetical protein
LERLEDRELLSIGLGPTVAPPTGHSAGAQTVLAATQHAVAAGDSTDPGPTIGGVALSHMLVGSQTQADITWNVTDAAGVQSSGITIDGNAVTKLYGPFTASSGVNYAAVYSTLAAGPHTYVITATDSNGATSQDTGTFTVVGPTIGGVAVAQAHDQLSWNVADATGVLSSSVTIDGNAMTQLYGPFTAASGVNYAAVYGRLPAGAHTYVITATDSNGTTVQRTGTFTLVGPTIGGVAVAQSQHEISWNVTGPAAVQSTGITIDGNALTKLYGPFAAASGVNYAAVYGDLAAGAHTYVVTVLDSNGTTAARTGTFTIVGPAIGGIAVSQSLQQISWNVVAAAGVQSSSIAIDGNAVTAIGPFTASSGVNYAAVYGAFAAGAHTYVITATDSDGVTVQHSGTFTLVGPLISGVAVSPAGSESQGQISWNVADTAGVQSSSVTVDGNAVTNLDGPFGASFGVNYAAVYGTLLAGTHTCVITATDADGITSQYRHTFTLAGATIGGVAINQANGEISWNAADAAGVQSTALMIDGNAVTNLDGPFAAASGADYAAWYGNSLAAGTHTFAITVLDDAGTVSEYTGTFVVGPVIGGVVVSTTSGQINWNVSDGGIDVASTRLSIDGAVDQNQYGPFTAANGSANYFATFGTLAAGLHTYGITAIDSAGNSATYNGSFTVS